MYSTLRRKTRINPISERRKREFPLYLEARAKFLEEHPTCQVCCGAKATQVHHKKRRRKNYLNTDSFLAVCAPYHIFIENNPKWAEEHGFLDRKR